MLDSALDKVQSGQMSDFSFILLANNLIHWDNSPPTASQLKWANNIVERLGLEKYKYGNK